MSVEIKPVICPNCGPVPGHRKGTNHILHLLLSVVTLGVWVPIWLMSCVKFGGWYCSKCASERVKTRHE